MQKESEADSGLYSVWFSFNAYNLKTYTWSQAKYGAGFLCWKTGNERHILFDTDNSGYAKYTRIISVDLFDKVTCM